MVSLIDDPAPKPEEKEKAPNRRDTGAPGQLVPKQSATARETYRGRLVDNVGEGRSETPR
jgi:hypothetical protein